jgi:hypothetical protein
MFGNDSRHILAVYAALFVSGFLYNALTAWLKPRGYDQGDTAILGVRGTPITLARVTVAGWQAVALALGASACPGFWVVVGSWWRCVQAQQAGQEAQREDLL